jgi:lysyl-tRNA synthetase class 2
MGSDPGWAEGDIYTPSEVFQLKGRDSQRLRAGGRLDRGPSGLRLADAFAALDVDLAEDAATPGCIAVVEGTLREQRLIDCVVLEHQAVSAAPLEFERLFHQGTGRRLQLRARVFAEVRSFFGERGFLELDTPLWSSECGTETHVEPVPCGDGYLITSPELHMKRLLVGGVFKSFQIAHCFRSGERGPLHSPEFLLLEWYRAFSGYRAVMVDTEELLHALCRAVSSSSSVRLQDGRELDFTPPFERLSVREAFARFADIADAAALAAVDEDQYFQLLVDRVEPALERWPRPVFLYDYPASQAALARLSPNDPSVAERFELYAGGIELCNGYGELNAADEQRARCELERARRKGLGRHVPAMPARFLGALEQGMPRAGGNALGLDRVIAILSGASRIDAVRAFPDGSA